MRPTDGGAVSRKFQFNFRMICLALVVFMGVAQGVTKDSILITEGAADVVAVRLIHQVGRKCYVLPTGQIELYRDQLNESFGDLDVFEVDVERLALPPAPPLPHLFEREASVI